MTVRTSPFMIPVGSTVAPNTVTASIHHLSPGLRRELLPNRYVHSSAAKPAFFNTLGIVYPWPFEETNEADRSKKASHWQERVALPPPSLLFPREGA